MEDALEHKLAGRRIIVSGATGLVGQRLMDALHASGAKPVALTRKPDQYRGEAIGWNPMHGQLDARALEGSDAIVHLAGESIAGSRWTAKRKRRIWESRIKSTELLVQAIKQLQQPPRTFIGASAIGYYG